jgi:choline kinase
MTIDALKFHGVERITVVAGHLEHVMRHHLSHVSGLEIDIVTNPRFHDTNSMFSLLLGLSHIDETFWLIEADVAFEPRVLNCERRFPITWLVDSTSELEGSWIRSDKTGRASGVDIVRDTNHLPRGAGKSVGIIHVSSQAIGTLRQWLAMDLLDRRECCYYDLTLGHNMPTDVIGVCDVAGHSWYEVDTWADLRTAEKLFR